MLGAHVTTDPNVWYIYLLPQGVGPAAAPIHLSARGRWWDRPVAAARRDGALTAMARAPITTLDCRVKRA